MKKTLLFTISTFIAIAVNAQIVITEIMYNPPESGSDSTEFVELYNSSSSPVDLKGYYFTQGVTHTFQNSTIIPAGTYAVITVDSAAFHSYYGVAATEEWASGSLLNGGEDITLKDSFDITVDSVNYNDNAPWVNGSSAGKPDGGGASLSLCNASSDNNDALNWIASTSVAGITINGFAVLASPFGADILCNVVAQVPASLASNTASQLENVITNDTIWFNLASVATQTDSIAIASTDISATYGVDYSTIPDISSGAFLSIGIGDSTAMIIVNMIDDAIFEGDETFSISIDSTTDGLSIGAISTLTYTITEDDVPLNSLVTFSSTSSNVVENAVAFELKIDLSLTTVQEDTIWVEVMNGTNVVYGSVNDYSIDSVIVNDTFMIVVPTGIDSTGFNFIVNDDAIVELSETVTFNIVKVTGDFTIGGANTNAVTIQDNDVASLPFYSISTVTTGNTNGVTDSLNVACRLTGIVYGENFRASSTGLSFTLIDNTGGINCFTNLATFGYNVTEGDSIVVEGSIGQLNGFTQLYLDTIILITQGNSIKAPTSVTVLSESTESELIKLDSVVIVNPSQWNTGVGSGFTVDVTDGITIYAMRIDNDCNLFNMSVPTYAFSLTGIGGQSDSTSAFLQGYQILPRRDLDIDSIAIVDIDTLSIKNNVEKTFSIYPNPTKNVLNLVLLSNDVSTISIMDLSGKNILSISTNKLNNSISVENLENGIYFIEVKSDNLTYRTKFIKN